MIAQPETLRALAERIAEFGPLPALVALGADGPRTVTFVDLAAQAATTANTLIDLGIAAGEPVGIVGPNTPAWVVACLGILKTGAVVMPLDPRQGEYERATLIARSGCRYLFAADRASLFAGAEAVESREFPPLLAALPLFRLPGNAPPRADLDGVALLMHTSGTTGAPKAVPLTHANVLANIRPLAAERLVGPGDRALQPLPMHHVYPLVVGLLLPLAIGVTLIYPAGIAGPELAAGLKIGDPNLLLGVPRLYGALLEAVLNGVRRRGPVVFSLFRAALRLSAAFAVHGWPALGRVLFRGVRQRIAPNLTRLISGGAALEEMTERALLGLGYEVLTGYGLTETAPIMAFNRPGAERIGSAGRQLEGASIRIGGAGIDGDGTIEVRGPNVFAGYRDDAAATDAAFTADGWFKTGDRGRIDAQGYLYVLGRAGDLLVLPNGEKVDPEALEARYAASAAIAEIAVLVDEGRLVGLAVPSARSAENFDHGEAAIRAALPDLITALPTYLQLSGIAVSDLPLPRTALGKLRRYQLPALYRAAAARRGAATAASSLSAADRALLDDPAAQRVWKWLEARYPGRMLAPDTSLQLDLGIDSLGWFALSLEAERSFGVALDAFERTKVANLRDLVKVIVSGRKAAAAVVLPRSGLLARAVWRVLLKLDRAVMRAMFRTRAQGLEHLPSGPYILCPNHASYLDAPALAAVLPWPLLRRLWWAGAADTMFSDRLRRAFSGVARVLPVDPARGARAGLALSVEALRRGGVLVWFPEGWRSADGALQPFLPGIGALVTRAAVPVVPVRIEGTFAAWPRQRRLPRRTQITVRFGPPLRPELWQKMAASPNPDEALAAEIRAAVARL